MIKYLSILGLFLCLNAKSQDLSVTLTTRNETCNLGGATVTVLLGAEPYSYLWSDGATTKTNNKLSNGNYNVKVTADNGKDTILYFTIEYEGCEISAEPYFTPNNDEYNDTWSISNLEKYPLHKRVLLFKSKYDKDTMLAAADKNELEKFFNLLIK